MDPSDISLYLSIIFLLAYLLPTFLLFHISLEPDKKVVEPAKWNDSSLIYFTHALCCENGGALVSHVKVFIFRAPWKWVVAELVVVVVVILDFL